MAKRRISMKRVREALRLYEECNLSKRQISQALKVSRPVVSNYLDKCKELALTYQKAQKMTDDELTNVFANQRTEDPRLLKLNILFPKYEKELSRVGVTKHILWDKYISENPDGYKYSQFCHHFKQWGSSKEIYMRIEHKAGDKLYVDYTGKKLEIVDRLTGEIRKVEVFVASLGASKLIYAEATLTQQKHDFIAAQINALKYIGGVPAAIVPDCLKSAVTKGHRYEPDINPEYQEFASHYNTTVLPARPYKPKDKALVEGSVKIVYQQIFAPLRDRVFLSLADLNAAIRTQLNLLNNKQMQEYEASRCELFDEIDKDALKPLPVETYQIRHYKQLKVNYNYHINIKDIKHNFSTPYQYYGKRVDVFYTAKTVEIYYKNERIAFHTRGISKTRYTTIKDHMPPNHKYMDNWNPERLLGWAENYGDSVKEVIETVLSSKNHPEQGYKTCMGILVLAKEFGKERLNKASEKALVYDNLSCKFIQNMLRNKKENLDETQENNKPTPDHENLRGSSYYQDQEEI